MDTTFPIFRGFGLEHEVMFFYNLMPELKEVKNGKPIFTPITTKQAFNAGAIFKYLREKADLPKEDLDFINSLPALEQSGRKCGGEWVLKKAGDDLLIEFANRGWFEKFDKDTSKNRTLEQFVDDIIYQEIRFRQIIENYLPDDLKKKDLGFVSPITTGMYPLIQGSKSVKSPNVARKSALPDYTGSYHITITLPFPFRQSWQYTKKENNMFIEIHRNFANMIQWIEPLLCSSLFTPDLSASGPQENPENPKTRGSFRVFNLGWGNFAGSDLRKLNKGISRYANIKPYWRKNLKNMNGTKKLKLCDKVKLEPGAISAVGSDFRTFGSRDLLRPWHRESGMPMTIPNGLEIRILDHFDPIYLYFVVQLVALIAEHSRTKNIGENYVYKNKGWIGAMDAVMRHGWRAKLPDSYIKNIAEFFDVEFAPGVHRAYNIFEALYTQLWKKHNDGLWSILLCSQELLKNKLPVPNVNRNSWEMGFYLWLAQNQKEQKIFKEWLHSLPNNIPSWEMWNDYWLTFISMLPEKYQSLDKWGNQDKDVAYLLESLGMFHINHHSGDFVRDKEFNLDLMDSLLDNWNLSLLQLPIFDYVMYMNKMNDVNPKLGEQFKLSSRFKEYNEYFHKVTSSKFNAYLELYQTTFKNKLYQNTVPESKKDISTKNKDLLLKQKILPTWITHTEEHNSTASNLNNGSAIGAGMGDNLATVV